MPRANRYFLPGHVWHITHRCHQKDFLLKFSKDRQPGRVGTLFVPTCLSQYFLKSAWAKKLAHPTDAFALYLSQKWVIASSIIVNSLPGIMISCKNNSNNINKAVSRRGIDRNLPISKKPVFCLIHC